MTKEEKQKAINALKISTPIMAMTPNEFDDYIKTLNKLMDWLEQEPCEDCVSRNKVLEGKVIHQSCDGVEIINSYAVPVEYIEQLPSIQPTAKENLVVGDCISRQIISDYVGSHIQEINTGYGDLNKHTNEILRMIVDYIESIPPVTPQPKTEWIPVSERLPVLRGKSKISEDVLITNGFETDIGYLVERKGKIFWHYYGGEYEFGIKDEDNDAIAWMPLPEPYKAESEGI